MRSKQLEERKPFKIRGAYKRGKRISKIRGKVL